MDIQLKQKDWLFLLVCFGLGILAELSFFHGKIGLAYPLFITGFYLVIFLRYRLSFNHRRIGLLIMVAVWILAGSFLFIDTKFFYGLNILIIPALVYYHLVLITSPRKLKWERLSFLRLLTKKLQEGVQYSTVFCKVLFRRIFKNMSETTIQLVKRIVIGLAIGIPLLLVVIVLLMSADAVFEQLVLQLPNFVFQLSFQEWIFRFILVILITLLFFGVFQVLHIKTKPKPTNNFLLPEGRKKIRWDAVTAITVLVMLNAVYLLFATIQLPYFFSDYLLGGFTYASYARRGFFELLFVTLINWTILISCLKLVNTEGRRTKLTLKILYTLIIAVSGIMLASAYQRLSMYEAAYGFTLERILAHAFMIYLLVIFAYTFIRVWLEGLTLLHFYTITALVFYAALNMMNVEQVIVNNNLDRFEQTGKIDVYYLNTLSSTGLGGLIALYEIEPDYPELRTILKIRQEEILNKSENTWQSFNFTRQEVTGKIMKLDLEIN
ncbi:DUF4153 domain-containing protein [Oceanobacillus chungangensis]|uniref:Uncharacterized protein n=1 Tax=Oceanobacillus chungangensis TaxID=1229152 RepID=A0A3D8PLY0_9BACI|nr:DUF4173 domain-containing protein [Oceanobacillus chungangensis]RDW16249.1 hypothetical protein CWR45_15355 [Oceanobacillus chungangensis]